MRPCSSASNTTHRTSSGGANPAQKSLHLAPHVLEAAAQQGRIFLDLARGLVGAVHRLRDFGDGLGDRAGLLRGEGGVAADFGGGRILLLDRGSNGAGGLVKSVDGLR